MRKIFVLCIIIISCNYRNNDEKKDRINSQKININLTKTVAEDFMRNVDSIIIVNHISYDNSPPDIKTGKLPENASLLINKKLNKKIVIKSVKLSENDKTKLAKILDKNVVDDIEYTHCFDPHNSVLAYKGENIYYLDFCFDCLGYFKKEFPFDSTMSTKKYEDLKAFFLRYRLNY